LDDPLHEEVKNKDGKTAWEVFKEEHKTLIREGNNWIKDRSNTGMLVATLIATITFAAAITVPGGINQDKGIPIFLTDIKFRVFILSDTIAFFCSMSSLLLFLAAINGRYTEEDYAMRMSVVRFLIGLELLSVAAVATMVAFITALSIFLEGRFKFFILFISLLSLFPIRVSLNNRFPYSKMTMPFKGIKIC
jgi:K+-sensing histidine kinase KdpD